MKKKIRKRGDKKAEWEIFDDCAICQAMKNGQANTCDGLSRAFAEQNLKNSVMTMRVQNKNDLYYDALSAVEIDDFKSAEEMLLKAKDVDPNYVQTYIGLVSAYSRPKDKKKREENIVLAFEKVKKIFPTWPDEMLWGYIENRAYLRAIQYMADLKADRGKIEDAVELYKLILKLNPGDNQGVRYVLAGLYAGISGDQINMMFDEGNRKQDWSKLEKLVKQQNKKYNFWGLSS